MSYIDASLQVFTNNIVSLVSIYKESELARNRSSIELKENIKSWSEIEQKRLSHYVFHFESVLVQSLFISGFSYFEHFMKDAVETLEEKSNSEIKFHDIKGKGFLESYRKYLYLVGNLPSATSDSELWEKILDYRVYRDVIIKNTLKYFDEIKKVEDHAEYFEKEDPISHSLNGQILEEFVSTVISYMSCIAKELKNL